MPDSDVSPRARWQRIEPKKDVSPKNFGLTGADQADIYIVNFINTVIYFFEHSSSTPKGNLTGENSPYRRRALCQHRLRKVFDAPFSFGHRLFPHEHLSALQKQGGFVAGSAKTQFCRVQGQGR